MCQYLPADPIDTYVVGAFLEALAPAELDLYETAMQQRRDHQKQLDTAHRRELERLRYEADLARRQFNRVDPDNRLVASELERRWEVALFELRQTEERYEREAREREKIVPISISRDYRGAFESLGKSLPALWRQAGALSRHQRKALLRCVIDKVVLHRTEDRDRISVRIVWRGGAVSEAEVSVRVLKLHNLRGFPRMEQQLLELAEQGRGDEDIAKELTNRGFRCAHSTRVLPSTVRFIRLQHGIIRRYDGPRPRSVKGFLTLPQVAAAVGVKKYWIYHLIAKGVIQVSRDTATGLYLFPDSPQTLAAFRRLKEGKVTRLSY